MRISSPEHILFFGDSITDAGRDRTRPEDLGQGYVREIADHLSQGGASAAPRLTNRGVSGNRIYDLEERLERDVLDLRPSLVSILIGINDTWRLFDSGVASPPAEFQASYRRILERLRGTGCKVMILEPFLLPVPDDRRAWRADVDARIAAIRELAWEFRTPYLPLDGLFAAAAVETGPAHWLPDGVHPSPAGHALIAARWLELLQA